MSSENGIDQQKENFFTHDFMVATTLRRRLKELHYLKD